MADTIPDVPVPVIAWKAFRRNRKLQWTSPIFEIDRMHFKINEKTTARCPTWTQLVIVSYFASKETATEWKDQHGPAPGTRCTCGFYVCKDRETAMQFGSHVARVRVWGKVIEHEHGYRAQFLELIEKPVQSYAVSHHIKRFFRTMSWWFRIYLLCVTVINPITTFFQWRILNWAALLIAFVCFIGMMYQIFSKKGPAGNHASLGSAIRRALHTQNARRLWNVRRWKRGSRDTDTKP